MTTPLLFMRWVLLLLGLLAGYSAQASHVLGGEVFYRHLGGSQYRIVFRVYRDCGGAAVSTLQPRLEYQASGCSGFTSSVPMTLVGGSQRADAPYCATIGNACGSGQRTNQESADFDVILALPPTQWKLIVTLNARPTMGNVNSGSGNLYCEAALDNRNGLNNTSAVFTANTLAVAYVGWNQPTSFSAMAVDADGDSLAYELVAPLVGCNDPFTYKSFVPPALVDPTDPACVVNGPAAVTYSPTLPLLSYNVTGSCPLKQAQPFFSFGPSSGAISVKPALFTAAVNSPENKYAISVKVSEYRRLGPGSYVFVGSIRREMMLVVVDAGTNQTPALGPVTVNNSASPQPASTVIPVRPGQLVSVRLPGTDANGNQILTMSSNAEQVLPNAEFTPPAPGFSPTAQLDWLPPATLRPGLYYCTVTTTDENCPIKASNTQTLTFRVGSPSLATQAARPVTTLNAVPTPFQSQVSFTLAQPGVQAVLVFDQLGRPVTTLRSLPSGEVQWRPAAGVPAGLYLARTADGRQVARLLRTE
ncbi:hypothetical protein E5K00_01745 [Hymenobacter aquaticus]|uniref:T9SS type A sorting domain-containing protein n=1 Tax=Hymenobacter aquaticus TaxID=1867101 RepID=A0A4Z0Q2Z9_9BACT|nr:hypothetical protein [Hymenobacter aquaticus]TGE23964.1 hypothetical protein E5K00_01745 [Hymenobacter aquaticus]